jgi:hypothetical protein
MMSQTERILNLFERFPTATVLFQTVDGELFTELPDAQAHAVTQLSQVIVNIARPATFPVEILPHGGKWVFLPDGANDILQDNLIVNGLGELGDSTNFSKFTKDVSIPTVYPQGYTVSTKNLIATDALIPVDPKEGYILECDIMVKNTTTPAIFIVGLQCFDQDGLAIEVSHFQWGIGYSRLTKALVPGDTTIELKNFTGGGWDDTNRGIVFCGHTYKNGKTDASYGREIIENAYSVGGVVFVNANKSIMTLNAPYGGAAKPIGTIIRNVGNKGLHLIKTDGFINMEASTQPQHCKWFFYDTLDLIQFPQLIPQVKFVKFFVQQKSLDFFDLSISGIKLRRVQSGADISPEVPGVAYDPVSPVYNAADGLKNGYRYYTPDGLRRFETLNGQWIEFGYTLLTP